MVKPFFLGSVLWVLNRPDLGNAIEHLQFIFFTTAVFYVECILGQ